MRHWSEDLVEEFAQHLGGSPDRRLLVELLAATGREIDVLAGRSFQPLHRATAIIDSGGLPLVDVPDLQVGSMETTAGVGAHNSVVGADQGFRAPSWDQESVRDSGHEDSASAPIAAGQRPRPSFRHPCVS